MPFNQICYFSASKILPVKLLWMPLFFIGLFFTQNVSAQAVEKWSLEKCVQYALVNNVTVRQAELTAKSSAADHLQSKMNLLPTLDINGSYNDDFGNGFDPQTFSFAQGNSQSLQLQATANLPLFTGLQQIYNVAPNMI